MVVTSGGDAMVLAVATVVEMVVRMMVTKMVTDLWWGGEDAAVRWRWRWWSAFGMAGEERKKIEMEGKGNLTRIYSDYSQHSMVLPELSIVDQAMHNLGTNDEMLFSSN
ncbi:hypothetical protein Tco_0525391 [Tanacetum coccineum]